MNRYIPGRIELIVFILMAFASGLIVQFSPQKDYVLGVLTVPIFLFAALRGLRRHGELARVEIEQKQTAE